jgi:hypothetical protein
VAELSVEDPMWNPRPVHVSDVRAILDDAYNGRRPMATARASPSPN